MDKLALLSYLSRQNKGQSIHFVCLQDGTLYLTDSYIVAKVKGPLPHITTVPNPGESLVCPYRQWPMFIPDADDTAGRMEQLLEIETSAQMRSSIAPDRLGCLTDTFGAARLWTDRLGTEKPVLLRVDQTNYLGATIRELSRYTVSVNAHGTILFWGSRTRYYRPDLLLMPIILNESEVNLRRRLGLD